MNKKAALPLSTFGQRIKHARLACGLSQSEFAAAISNISESRASKGLVSQWETGRVNNPQNVTMLAIAAVTGFSQLWLISGKGPERAAAPTLASKDTATRALLRRAVLIACAVQTMPASIADAALEVFDMLQDDPSTPDAALKRIAKMAVAA